MSLSIINPGTGLLSSHASDDQSNRSHDPFGNFMNQFGRSQSGLGASPQGGSTFQAGPSSSLLLALGAAANFPNASISAQCSVPYYGSNILSAPTVGYAGCSGYEAANDGGLSYQPGCPLSGSVDTQETASRLRDFNGDGGDSYQPGGPLSGSFDMAKNRSTLNDFSAPADPAKYDSVFGTTNSGSLM